ncbi:MAG: DUF1893 domain-containing protein [Candidatus Bathyarchaeota archaeon]|nr:DUF1893 domain-containing protein [Candidatus Bathyarchaeota archaeon]
MNQYLEALEQSGNSLMIYKDDELIFESASKGIRPHLEAIDKHGEDLKGSVMVDKIVGRAAALLILYSKARKVFAALISEPGRQVLEEHNLDFSYVEYTEHIKMKDGRIFCPFERMVQDISDPDEAYVAIVEKMNSFKAQASS